MSKTLSLTSTAEVRQASMTTDTSHTSQTSTLSQSHDKSHDPIAVESELYKEMGGARDNQATPTIEESTHITAEPSFYDLQGTAQSDQSTQQNVSEVAPIDIYHHGNEGQTESPPQTPDSKANRKLKPPDLDLISATPTQPLSDDVVIRHHNDDRPSIGSRQFERIMSYHEAGPNASYLSPMSVGRKLGDYSCPAGPVLTSSLRSLPATFSPVTTPRSNHKYLGYDPMQISEVTLSYPELGPPVG